LWISGTNPAVSLPDLARIRRILAGDQCFVVVSDGYRTETTELADVVLPAALWGEKTGTHTNVDRTVHLSEQAVDPPGQARSDLAIWMDYARRMNLTDKDGHPLPAWNTPAEAFEAWKACSAGRPCDYSGLSYALLHDQGGIQWPATPSAPEGTERLYVTGEFPTTPEYCETYGHDLATGAPVTETQYRAACLDGRAILKTIPYDPAYETPDGQYPLRLTTGRTVYHFHTRTKTHRAPQLQAAAPAMWVELSEQDATRLGIAEGDLVRVTSRRGHIDAPARISHVREGVVFAPWHYGDTGTAANELTLTAWDPVSKQPEFKIAAVSVHRLRAGDGPAPRTHDDRLRPRRAPIHTTPIGAMTAMHLPTYLTLLDSAERTLADAYRQVAEGHTAESDMHYTCIDFARRCTGHAQAFAPTRRRYHDRRQPNQNDCTRPEWSPPGTGRSGCCATCKTSTNWPPSPPPPGTWSPKPPTASATTT
jgi:predicted molibdopterin-dependent oxidoreductase YjgC